MKYYIINHSMNKKVLGHYPQIKEVVHNCHIWNEPRFIEHTHFEKINFTPITSDVVLFNKSKITDLIVPGTIGFSLKILISSRLRKIFEEKGNQNKLQFFQSSVYHKEMQHRDFWILNFYNPDFHVINFSNSDIYLTENTFTLKEKINILTVEDFKKKLEEVKKTGYPLGIRITRYTIKDNIKEHLILLTDVEGGVNYLVSETLKIEIEKAGCTGIEFQPIEFTLTEWLQGGEREKVYGKS